MGEGRLDAELVEDVAEERHFRLQPDQPDRAQRLQPDFIERGGQVIGAGARPELAETLGKGDRELALGAERGDRVAHLLAGRQADRVAANAGIDALDPVVAAGAVQCVEKIAQGRRTAEGEGRQRVGLWPLGEALAEIDGQDDRVGQARLRPGKPPCRHPDSDDQHGGRQPQQGEQANDKATHGNSFAAGIFLATILSARYAGREAFKIAPAGVT